MKTVYDHFWAYADNLLEGKDNTCKRNVALGLKALLRERGMLEEADPDGRIANRDLTLFKLMPVDTFIACFENYELCAKILQFRMNCERLATARLISDALISAEAKMQKLADFYDLVADLALDNRYSSWIDDIATQVRLDLAFAAGQTVNVSDEVARIYFDGLGNSPA